MARIGIFGGSFNPPHKEHLSIALAAVSEMSLDKVCFIPTYNAPHKSKNTDYQLRVLMLKQLIKGYENQLDVDTVESEIEGKTYTAVVLSWLKEKNPQNEYTLIIGGDSFLLLKEWYKPQTILAFPIFVIPRGNQRENLQAFADQMNSEGANIRIANYEGDDRISSSQIRACIALGEQPHDVSNEVYDVVVKHGLYQQYKSIVEQFTKSHSQRLVTHSYNTVKTAIYLARNSYLNYEQVFLAALLHDNMKERDFIYEGVPKDSYGSPVLHAFNGAFSLKPEYNITDNQVFSAVYYHTTGRANMSLLEKTIFLADMIEPNRSFDGVDLIRQTLEQSFDYGFWLAVERTYLYLLGTKKDIYYLTKECYDYYKRSFYDE